MVMEGFHDGNDQYGWLLEGFTLSTGGHDGYGGKLDWQVAKVNDFTYVTLFDSVLKLFC